MGKYTPEEIAQDFIAAFGNYPQIKVIFDRVAAIPVADRKPSTYMLASAEVLTILAPLGDSVQAHIAS